MPSDRRAVELALTDRLKQQLGPARSAHFVGGTHTRRFADNLLPTLPAWQIDELYAELKAGGGSEISVNKNGKRRAHAPYSSAAMAFNVFGRWLGSEHALAINGLSGFDERLKIESKKKIRHGGGTANLDVVLSRSGVKVGVECKLAEHSSRHNPASWDPVYSAPAIAQLLDSRWRKLMKASSDATWRPRRLGVEQLIKHALGLRSQHPNETIHIVYVYWEPANAGKHPWVAEHRRELQELQEYVHGSEICLHHQTYWDLLNDWEKLTNPPPWLPEHVAAVRARYHVKVPASA